MNINFLFILKDLLSVLSIILIQNTINQRQLLIKKFIFFFIYLKLIFFKKILFFTKFLDY